MQERRERLLLSPSQRRQHWLDGLQTSFKELLANGSTFLADVQSNLAFVGALAALHKAISDQPIDETHGSRVGQAENVSQLIV